jgi:hypothetical protein
VLHVRPELTVAMALGLPDKSSPAIAASQRILSGEDKRIFTKCMNSVQ